MAETRSPYKQAVGQGSARRGSGDWLAQRLTALALIPLLCWFVWGLFGHLLAGRGALIGWLATPAVGIFASLALGVACYHAYLGFRVVVEDYVHTPVSRGFLLIALRFLFFVVAFADVFMILRLSLRIP